MTAGLLLDLALVALIVIEAVHGWRRGLVATALGLIGLIAGAAGALWLIPQLVAYVPSLQGDSLGRSVLVVVGVLLGALIGQSLLGSLAYRLMANRRNGALGRLDSFAGTIANALISAVILGLISMSIYPVAPPSWRAAMNESRAVGTLTDSVPPQVVDAAHEFTTALYEAGFPKVFGDPGQEPALPAEAPNSEVTRTQAVQQAAGSVVRIQSSMSSCGRAAEGSGWVVQSQRVVTNAHVVAGSDAVSVQIRGRGRAYPASVVAFDPDLDLAILDVPGLPAPALRRAGELRTGAEGVVAGYPLGGPYRTDAARVRGVVDATGSDIYERRSVHREIYSLYTTVNPGDSGGPFLTPEGSVAGTVFAKSLSSASTGFALTDRATAAMLDRAAEYRRPVPTQACSVG